MRRKRTVALPFLLALAATVHGQRDDRADMLQGIEAKRESYAAPPNRSGPSPKSAIRSRRAARSCSSNCARRGSR